MHKWLLISLTILVVITACNKQKSIFQGYEDLKFMSGYKIVKKDIVSGKEFTTYELVDGSKKQMPEELFGKVVVAGKFVYDRPFKESVKDARSYLPTLGYKEDIPPLLPGWTSFQRQHDFILITEGDTLSEPNISTPTLSSVTIVVAEEDKE